MSLALFAIGYPVAILCILRGQRIMLHRLVPWFLAHQIATLCVVAGWYLRGRAFPVLVNLAWFIAVLVIWIKRGEPREQ